MEQPLSKQENKQDLLQKNFGFNQFRPLQEEVVDAILAKQDVLLILPTGGGKSLCYQLPALLLDGVTVVISPLIALMQDQVVALKAKGIAAEMLSSLQSFEGCTDIYRSVRQGEIKLLFVAPERLQNDFFSEFLESINIAFFAIDEAHCVSEWGHDFRSDYRLLGNLKDRYPGTSIAAFTATATHQVETDIVNQLQFSSRQVIRGSVFRDNLTIDVRKRSGNGYSQILEFLKDRNDEQGIIYTLSRDKTKQLAEYLQQQGYNASYYHAGLDADKRKQVFSDFVNDRIDIMVATIAFGMGIDKSNIRFVAHMSLPKTLESYYQEIGRAGRDGLDASTLLLYSNSDLVQLGNFLQDIENESFKQLSYAKLDTIKKYAYQEGCRHRTLSEYFGDAIDDCKTLCDNCLQPDTDRTDISELAQKLLSSVYRLNQRFGLVHVIDVLMGSSNQKVLSNNHDQLSVYGIGQDVSKSKWRIISDRLLELNLLQVGEYKVIQLTDQSRPVLKGEQKVDIRSIHLQESKSIKKIKAKVKDSYDVDPTILDELKNLRRQLASEAKVPAYIVFDDKALREMAHFMPTTEHDFLNINGVGEVKNERYGKAFINLIESLAN